MTFLRDMLTLCPSRMMLVFLLITQSRPTVRSGLEMKENFFYG